MAEKLRIALAGLGTVGAGVIKLLAQNAALIERRAGRGIEIVAVSARDRARDRGVDLSRFEWVDDTASLAARDDVDAVVELIGGSDEPALTLARAALSHGKAFVTANKAMLAHHGLELAAAAEAGNTALKYEAAVAGGIPVIKGLREGAAANVIDHVYGVLNGTCNYILTTMESEGRDFAEVLSEAQALGYAEADPSFDIDGVDAAHKLAILSSLAFGTRQGWTRWNRPLGPASPKPTRRTRKPSAAASAMSAARTWRMPVIWIASKSTSVPKARLERMASLCAASTPSMSKLGSASA